MLTLTVEAHDGSLQENAKDAIRLAMKLNCKIMFTYDKKQIIADPLKDPMEIVAASKVS